MHIKACTFISKIRYTIVLSFTYKRLFLLKPKKVFIILPILISIPHDYPTMNVFLHPCMHFENKYQISPFDLKLQFHIHASIILWCPYPVLKKIISLKYFDIEFLKTWNSESDLKNSSCMIDMSSFIPFPSHSKINSSSNVACVSSWLVIC